MPIVLCLIQSAEEKIDYIAELITPRVLKKTGAISLGAAAVTTLIYSLYQKINTPPRHLKHMPYITRYQYMKTAFTDELLESYSESKVMPILRESSNGVYVRPSALGWSVMISNPIILKKLLFMPEKHLPKKSLFLTEGTLIYKFFGRPSVVFSNGDVWRRHRKVLNPVFLQSLPVKKFGNVTVKLFDAIEREGLEKVDVYHLFERWALDAIGLLGFDFDFNALGKKDGKWVIYYNTIKTSSFLPLYIFFPKFDTTFLQWFKKRQQVHFMLDELTENISNLLDVRRCEIQENRRKYDEDQEKDFLTLLVEDETQQKTKLTKEEIVTDMLILFTAGHDTTTFAINWCLYELAKHPHIQEKARDEAINILGDSPEDIIPTANQLKQLSYVNMILKEVLRRHPSLYSTSARIIQEDMVVAGAFLPKGAEVVLDIYNLHHNPAIWKDPYKFDPDRFLPGGEADNQEGLAYAPFSHGQRQCLGMNSSLTQLRVALCMLCKVRKYKWTIPENSPHKEKPLKSGVVFVIGTMKAKLELNFEKRY